MDKLLRFIAVVLLVPLIYAFAYEAYLFVTTDFAFHLLRYFVLGFATYLLVYLIIAGRRVLFFEVFEHELGHALTGLVFFQNVEGFAATPGQGLVVLDDANFMIMLAPYYLPVFAIPLLLIRPFVSPPIVDVADFLLGSSLAFHYGSLLRWEFRPSQPDLKEMGWWFSVGIALLMNAIILVLVLSVVLENYSAILEYFQSTWVRRAE